jgi:hypothetical protein
MPGQKVDYPLKRRDNVVDQPTNEREEKERIGNDNKLFLTV